MTAGGAEGRGCRSQSTDGLGGDWIIRVGGCGLLAQERDQAPLGAPARLVGGFGGHAVTVGPVGDEGVFQSGGTDQVRFGPGQDRLPDCLRQNQVRVTPRGLRRRGPKRSGHGHGGVQCLTQCREPSAVGGPPQSHQDPWPVYVDRREGPEESGKYLGMHVEHVVGEPGG